MKKHSMLALNTSPVYRCLPLMCFIVNNLSCLSPPVKATKIPRGVFPYICLIIIDLKQGLESDLESKTTHTPHYEVPGIPLPSGFVS